jgi:Tol biopolymer transport system component
LAFDGEGEGSRDIYIVNANGGEPRLLTTDPADDAVPSWSQDGKWIYFASQRTGDSQVWKIPVDGGKAVQITTTGGRWPYESPDGQYVYFAKSTGDFGLWRLPLAGGEDELVLNNVNGNMFTLAKRGIYFVTQAEGRRTINFLSFASRETKWVTDVESDFVAPSVSPDEKWILGVVREEMGSDLMLVGNFK